MFSCEFCEIFKNTSLKNTSERLLPIRWTSRTSCLSYVRSIYVLYPRGKEAVAQTYSVKKVFSEISQNPQENTYARVSILINFIKIEALAQVRSERNSLHNRKSPQTKKICEHVRLVEVKKASTIFWHCLSFRI